MEDVYPVLTKYRLRLLFSAGQDIGKESGEGVLIGIVDSGIDYEILISEMRMGQRELQHYGIRQWKPDCLLRAIM